ncbi:MAG: hypothetical protein QOJ99_256 [Bryobacterales bacterium]|nr:hypothetical protein [Bryobacterales bacterium]
MKPLPVNRQTTTTRHFDTAIQGCPLTGWTPSVVFDWPPYELRIPIWTLLIHLLIRLAGTGGSQTFQNAIRRHIRAVKPCTIRYKTARSATTCHDGVRIAKPSRGLKLRRGFESPSLRHLFSMVYGISISELSGSPIDRRILNRRRGLQK